MGVTLTPEAITAALRTLQHVVRFVEWTEVARINTAKVLYECVLNAPIPRTGDIVIFDLPSEKYWIVERMIYGFTDMAGTSIVACVSPYYP